MPAMTIQKDGKKLGHTPISFTMPGSNYPIVLRADWVERRYYNHPQRRDQVVKEVPRTLFRIVYPNATQVVDFNGFTAK